MKIKGVFFSLFIALIFNSASAALTMSNKPGSIERYSWIGGNSDGTIVAFILSHFGSSSSAPFVKLIVKKAGEVEPIFTDSASMMSGGERELEELASYLIEKNSENLQISGIKLSKDFISDANIVTPRNDNPTIISGWADINSDLDQYFRLISKIMHFTGLMFIHTG